MPTKNHDNVVKISGRVGKDPELRYTIEGKAYLRFPLAIPLGNKKKKSAWYNITAFGDLAEESAEAICKGCTVGVIGRLAPWEGKDGFMRYNSVVAEKFYSIEHPKKKGKQQQRQDDAFAEWSDIGEEVELDEPF